MVQDQVRIYATETRNPKLMEHMVAQFTAKHGGDWQRGIRWLSKGPDEFVYETCHLIKWGCSGLGEVEKHFDVVLPSWAHAFYQEVHEAVLSLGHEVIEILCPQDVISFEEEMRSYENHLPEMAMPVRLIRFARVVGSPVCIGFRKSALDGQWRIIVFDATSDSLEFIYSTKCEGKEDDIDVDIWMERMLRTDAYPVMVGFEESEKKLFRRIL